MYLNEVTVIGRITRDVEMKALPNGTNVANFSVATNRNWKDKDGQKQEEVEFHNVVAFAKRAETVAQYFHKGDEIFVRGRLRTRSWDSDGKKMYRTEIMLEQFEFGQKRSGSEVDKEYQGDQGQEEYNSGSTAVADGITDGEVNPEDIPF